MEVALPKRIRKSLELMELGCSFRWIYIFRFPSIPFRFKLCILKVSITNTGGEDCFGSIVPRYPSSDYPKPPMAGLCTQVGAMLP